MLRQLLHGIAISIPLSLCHDYMTFLILNPLSTSYSFCISHINPSNRAHIPHVTSHCLNYNTMLSFKSHNLQVHLPHCFFFSCVFNLHYLNKLPQSLRTAWYCYVSARNQEETRSGKQAFASALNTHGLSIQMNPILSSYNNKRVIC